MTAQIYKMLAKIGLNEKERKIVLRAVLAITATCALAVAFFWVYGLMGSKAGNDADGAGAIERDANIASSEVGVLDVEAHEFTARRHMQAGRPNAAIPHLRRIAALRRNEPEGIWALDMLVTAYLELSEFDKALETAVSLRHLVGEEESASLQVRKGMALYYMKEYEESARILREVLEREPDNVEALVFKGQMEAAAAAEGRSAAAERYFKRAMELDPNNIEAGYQLARYFENNGDYAGARALLQRVLEKDPLNVRAHGRLGMIHFYMRDPDQALKSYQTALALNPHDHNTRYNLGELYRVSFENEENALREFVAALELNPEHAEANYRAGLICAGNGMTKEAIRYFEAALRGDRQNIRRLLQLAAAYERLGDRVEALAVYKEITDIDPLHSIAIQKIRLLELPEV